MDLDSKTYFIGSAVGAILMLASLIYYIIEPADPAILIFVIGLVLLLIGYYQISRENRGLYREYEQRSKDEEADGFIMSFDEDYVPFDNPATIEDLRG